MLFDMSVCLRVLKDTILKASTRQSRDFASEEKISLRADGLKDFLLHSHRPEGAHYKVAFAETSFRGLNTWYGATFSTNPRAPGNRCFLD